MARHAGCTLFLKVHLRPILPLYNGSLVDRLRDCDWAGSRAHFLLHDTPSSALPATSCGNQIRARRAVIRPARRRHGHPSGASSRLSHHAAPDCLGTGRQLRLHASRCTRAGRGIHPPSSELALNMPKLQPITPAGRTCCTPHPRHPCARRTNEQVSWMGLALNDSPPPGPHARPRMSGANSPQPVSGCALLLLRPKISHQHQILGRRTECRWPAGKNAGSAASWGRGTRHLLVGGCRSGDCRINILQLSYAYELMSL